MMCAVSLGAAAQFPNLPYNPDENGDGLIGVVDLQGLLALYGVELDSYPSVLIVDSLEDQQLTWETVYEVSPTYLVGNNYIDMNISDSLDAIFLHDLYVSESAYLDGWEMDGIDYSSGAPELRIHLPNESSGKCLSFFMFDDGYYDGSRNYSIEFYSSGSAIKTINNWSRRMIKACSFNDVWYFNSSD